MDLYVADENFVPLSYINECQSIIWTERYCECGDFEICIPAAKEIVSLLKIGRFIYRTDSDRVMIIEKIQLDTDLENGDILICSGRSAESLLLRRIVWNSEAIENTYSAEKLIQMLIIENVIEPSNPDRKIPGIELGEKIGVIETVKNQYARENLLTAVSDICRSLELGFRLRKLGVSLEKGETLKFEIYRGTNHSESQSTNPFVIFSPDFENLADSSYCEDMTGYANAALVMAIWENGSRKSAEATLRNAVGVNRREIYLDASDTISMSNELDGINYLYMLYEKGRAELLDRCETTAFSGDLGGNDMYRYRSDYRVGDIVTVRNGYGINADVRLTEVTESESETGFSVIAKFIAEEETM